MHRVAQCRSNWKVFVPLLDGRLLMGQTLIERPLYGHTARLATVIMDNACARMYALQERAYSGKSCMSAHVREHERA